MGGWGRGSGRAGTGKVEEEEDATGGGLKAVAKDAKVGANARGAGGYI
jgi:hypothetical protein